MLPTIELSHPLQATPLRLVMDGIAWTLPLETSDLVLFTAAPWRYTYPQLDTSGRASTKIEIGDEDGTLRAWLSATKGSAEFVVATLRWYDDDQIVGGYPLRILGPSRFDLHDVVGDEPRIKAEGRSRSMSDRALHPERYTLENTLALKGH